MIQIDQKSIQKLVDMNNLLNNIEVKGASNISKMYAIMVMLEEILANIQRQADTSGITVDNTKEKK